MARRKLDVNGDIVLTEKQRQALILSAEKHTLAVNAARVTYPNPGEKLTVDKIKALGFTGAHDSLLVVRDDDDAEEAGADVVIGVGVGAVEQDLAVGVADGAEAFAGYAEELEHKPEQEVDVGGEALRAELELECKEFP